MRILMEAQGTLTPVMSKTQVVYAFPLPEGLAGLTIHFRYSPKLLEDTERAEELIRQSAPRYMEEPQLSRYLERWENALPLSNLLTLSLDDPSGFRGAAHRHSPEQSHRIGRTEASPGFLPGPAAAGIWQITISAHAVVTEDCGYSLKVTGWNEEEAYDGLA